MMTFVYILRSLKDHGYYIGFTNNLERRLQEHRDGLVDSTKYRRPVELAYYEAYQTETLARQREANLKQFGSAYKGLLKRIGET